MQIMRSSVQNECKKLVAITKAMEKNYQNFYYKKAKEKGGFNDGSRKIILDFIKNKTNQNRSLLEVGCGTGEISSFLPANAEYHGVDTSAFAIEQAAKNCKNKSAHFSLFEPKIGKLPFEKEKFDFALSIYSLEHFENPKLMLDEMARVLKNGGWLIILAPNLEFPFSFLNATRHKTLFFKSGLALLRATDYFLRILGVYKFRALNSNFSQETGKYEKIDDDLSYIVSSYEVINYLMKKLNFKNVFINTLRQGCGLKHTIKKLITFLPAMKYYGDMLFIIMKK